MPCHHPTWHNISGCNTTVSIDRICLVHHGSHGWGANPPPPSPPPVHITLHTSYITLHTSHITLHTSRTTLHTSHIIIPHTRVMVTMPSLSCRGPRYPSRECSLSPDASTRKYFMLVRFNRYASRNVHESRKGTFSRTLFGVRLVAHTLHLWRTALLSLSSSLILLHSLAQSLIDAMGTLSPCHHRRHEGLPHQSRFQPLFKYHVRQSHLLTSQFPPLSFSVSETRHTRAQRNMNNFKSASASQ